MMIISCIVPRKNSKYFYGLTHGIDEVRKSLVFTVEDSNSNALTKKGLKQLS